MTTPPQDLKPRPRGRFGIRRAGTTIITIVLVGAVIAGFVAMATATGWEDSFAQLGKLEFWQIAALLGLTVANYIFRGLRWYVFSRALGLPRGRRRDARHFAGGLAMTVTPGRLGEVIRLRWLARETGWSMDRTAPLILVDRAADLAAMALILAGMLALSAAGMAGAVPAAVIAAIVAVVLTRPSVIGGLVTWSYRILAVRPRLFARARSAARSLQRFSSPRVFIPGVLYGTIGWAIEGVELYLILTWIGADIGLPSAIGIFVFATFAGGLTGAPGGLGGAEASMIALMRLQGVAMGPAIAATAVIRLTTMWFAVLMGLVVLPYAERVSRRIKREREAQALPTR
ncbi:lysylphosphatidylglycerol synthase transmembrane domain-containing protein [Roseicyclus sp. F158]|uniref:Lysylphosphatidylglycerol synthase transmembrane domain-containing protein n=1 Tax=Tropicimonas omnivorans TaxID=3075590 RepID=A0ABU3DF71_9RHOB|nr:lysylphosphatidylglycerol synthase transmembrane domain-containing protein [Roseicyclus sp. F158]MDT0682371.1 lysylphosphatidylglycerol synthase transmembrane domain-containing protein [Roseicyclus sp. F158]